MATQVYHHNLDQPAQVLCESCLDNYCEVCFAAQHRKGSRKGHIRKALKSQSARKIKENGAAKTASDSNGDSVSSFLSFVIRILTTIVDRYWRRNGELRWRTRTLRRFLYCNPGSTASCRLQSFRMVPRTLQVHTSTTHPWRTQVPSPAWRSTPSIWIYRQDRYLWF